MKLVSNVLIVGGGIGGMAAGIKMSDLGTKVDLIDIDPDWRVYGAGITITGPTLRAYRRLGLIDEIAAQGAITSGSRIYSFTGAHIRDMDEPAIEGGMPATGGILRPVLHKIMQQRLKAQGAKVRLGLTVTDLEEQPDGVVVTFSDGSRGRYDLVVGADSVNSTVRELAFPHMGPAEYTGQGCWRISMKRPPTLERGEFYFGHQYPVGITPCAKDMIYLWMLTPHVRREKHFTDAELFANLRANLSSFGGNAGWIRDNMTPGDWINYRPLAAILQPLPWYRGRTVLLGDAVHATTPHLACGAGMAVESALVLAEELAAAASVEEGLASWQARRHPRCKLIVESSVSIGRMQLAGASAEEVGGAIGEALHALAQDY